MSKIWIYYENDCEFKQVDSSRCDPKYPYAPSGMVKFIIRKSNFGKDKWVYCHFGNTKLECYKKATAYDLRKIEEMEQVLIKSKQRLIEKYGEEPASEGE
jgi:hypothetical protein